MSCPARRIVLGEIPSAGVGEILWVKENYDAFTLVAKSQLECCGADGSALFCLGGAGSGYSNQPTASRDPNP